jgi:hypothetical protein
VTLLGDAAASDAAARGTGCRSSAGRRRGTWPGTWCRDRAAGWSADAMRLFGRAAPRVSCASRVVSPGSGPRTLRSSRPCVEPRYGGGRSPPFTSRVCIDQAPLMRRCGRRPGRRSRET